jgi:hypothetical protein
VAHRDRCDQRRFKTWKAKDYNVAEIEKVVDIAAW